MDRILVIIYTFLMYSFVIGFTLLFTYKANNSKNKLYFKVYSILAVLIPTIFAGMRALNVGTDIMVYAYQTFEKSSAYTSLNSFLNVNSIEGGYAALAFICSHLCGNVHVFLAFTAMLQIIPIYICAVKLRNEYNMIWPMMIYLMIFYIVGFNVMRQSIAASWMLLAFLLLEEKRYVKMIFTCIVALLFHSTAILGILFLLLALVFDKIRNKKILMSICIFFFIIFVYLMQYWDVIIVFIGKYGFLGQDKIVGYSNIFREANLSNYMYSLEIAQYIESIFKVLLIIPAIFYKNNYKNKYFNTSIGIYLMGILVYLFFFIYYHTSYGYRISIYAEYYLIVLLPFLMAKNKAANGKRIILLRRMPIRVLVTFTIAFMNWFILFVVLQTHGTYPFKLFFQ